MRKINKIRPVDYVVQEGADGPENEACDIPLSGGLREALIDRKSGVENRNFSCW